MNAFIKKKLISKIAPQVCMTGLNEIFRPVYGGVGHILMFHRIIPESTVQRIHNHLSLEITSEHFIRTILFFLKKKYKFISIDQLHEVYKTGIFPMEKFVTLTFDDGYRDNLEIAYPILKKYEIPFTVYVTTGIPNRKAILWWYLLEDLVREKEVIQFDWNSQSYLINSGTSAEKESAFETIQNIVHSSFTIDKFKELISALFDDFHSDIYKYSSMIGMNWREIRRLNEDPLVTIGAHTINHFPLSQLPLDKMKAEISGSKIELEKQLSEKIEHFSFPFGKFSHASTREFDYVKQLKFKTATTTNIGNLFPKYQAHLECLPRININRVTNEHVLNLQTSGLLPFIVNKGRKTII